MNISGSVTPVVVFLIFPIAFVSFWSLLSVFSCCSLSVSSFSFSFPPDFFAFPLSLFCCRCWLAWFPWSFSLLAVVLFVLHALGSSFEYFCAFYSFCVLCYFTIFSSILLHFVISAVVICLLLLAHGPFLSRFFLLGNPLIESKPKTRNCLMKVPDV